MSENDTPPPPRVPTEEEINAAAVVDPAALQRWFAIPEATQVVLVATRGDMDRLFLGLRMLAFAQGDHLSAFQQLSHGNIEVAQERFNSAAARHHQALATITQFTSSIMAKAQVDG